MFEFCCCYSYIADSEKWDVWPLYILCGFIKFGRQDWLDCAAVALLRGIRLGAVGVSCWSECVCILEL